MTVVVSYNFSLNLISSRVWLASSNDTFHSTRGLKDWML